MTDKQDFPQQTPVQPTRVYKAPESPQPGQKDPFYKKTWFLVLMLLLFPPAAIVLAWAFKRPANLPARIALTVVAALLVVSGIAVATNGNASVASSTPAPAAVEQQAAPSNEASAVNQEQTATEAAPKNEAPAVNQEQATEKEAAPAATATQQQPASRAERNAADKAKSYLKFTAFSHEGLIEQLEYDGFTHDQATYGADNCGADWDEQAAKKAESYLDLMSFSRTGLIEQLEYDGFTHDQATYGADKAGL